MNWGKGLAIAMVLFMSYIVYMAVILMQQNTDLVTEEYYKDEVNYEQEIDAQQNALNSRSKITSTTTENEILFMIDTPVEIEEMTLQLYRANAESDDFNLQLEEPQILIPKERLKNGEYKVTANWKSGDKSYQLRKTIWVE